MTFPDRTDRENPRTLATGASDASAVPCRAALLTPATSGAIAVIQVVGEAERVLAALSGHAEWPLGRCRLVVVPQIDDAVAVRLDPRIALIMPHGGPRIVQRMLERLHELGAEVVEPSAIPPQDRYPEAQSDDEIKMLDALARAESPLAIDLLLDQPRRWHAARAAAGRALHEPSAGAAPHFFTAEDLARSAQLDRLITPPCVAIVGAPNVGKSTLTNRLAGREVAIVADLPGTTRDAVLCTLELCGVAVRWFDTPGLRTSNDPLEQEAIAMAEQIVSSAACLIAVADARSDWPPLPRAADLRVATRCDLGRREDTTLHVSAVTGEGIDDLAEAIRERLVPRADLEHPGPWWFR